MSADLLAEFDSFYQGPDIDPAAASNQKSTSALEDLSFFEASTIDPTTSRPPQRLSNEAISKTQWGTWSQFIGLQAGPSHQATTQAFDPWDSFALTGITGIPTPQGSQSKNATHERANSHLNKPGSITPKLGIIRASTEQLFSAKIADLAETEAAQQEDDAGASGMLGRGSRDDVLFDADELSEEDNEFGEFETVGSPIPPAHLPILKPSIAPEKTERKPQGPLKTMENLNRSSSLYPHAPVSPPFRERNPFADLVLSTSPIEDIIKPENLAKDTPVTAWPSYEAEVPTFKPFHDLSAAQRPEDEDWGEFADLPAEASEMKLPKGGDDDSWGWDPVDTQIYPAPAPEPVADIPTNIPPPSVLLAIIPRVLNLPKSSLFQAVANQPSSLKNRILSDPSTIDFLRAYILLATVAARIIAGRKLRWKRDLHLSQAIQIGPAGKGGMKLSGVDKAESTKEEQEATELVRIWKENVGRLKSAVAAANSSLRDPLAHLFVPEIVEAMTIKTEGAITAPKACVICGLRREERILKVDYNVEDSFGEWWVEYWGHRICKNFWQEHKGVLRSR